MENAADSKIDVSQFMSQLSEKEQKVSVPESLRISPEIRRLCFRDAFPKTLGSSRLEENR